MAFEKKDNNLTKNSKSVSSYGSLRMNKNDLNKGLHNIKNSLKNDLKNLSSDINEGSKIIEKDLHSYEKKLHKSLERLLLASALIFVFFIIILASVFSRSSFLFAFLGFLPAIISLLILHWAVENDFKHEVYLLVPLLFTFLTWGVVYFFAKNQLSFFPLTIWNLLILYVIVFILIFVEKKPLFRIHSVKDDLRLLEDKCKAINFVIGRVYRSSNGGSSSLRKKIRIPPELYNEFSRLTSEINDLSLLSLKDKSLTLSLLDNLKKLKLILEHLMLREKEVFSKEELSALRNLKRDTSGNDPIVKVLANNDTDPFLNYYKESLKIINSLLSSLKNNGF